jgi:hypothetical protein
VLANRNFTREAIKSGKSTPLVLGFERVDGNITRFETVVFRNDHPRSSENFDYVERLVKSLIWLRGAWRVYVGGPVEIGDAIRKCYSADGARAFDQQFLGELIYEKKFEVVSCAPEDVPEEHESQYSLGRHLEGCRIGFDLGASDIKVSAVIDGNPIFSEEIVWEPVKQTDPAYHRREIMNALKLAASKLPRVDAIGGSSAGIFINNRVQVASLFRGIPRDKFDQVKNLFLEVRSTFGVPLEVINDGEVTAWPAQCHWKRTNPGYCLGSSEAAGLSTGRAYHRLLNELAFAPVDFNPNAPLEEWSGDRVWAPPISLTAVRIPPGACRGN